MTPKSYDNHRQTDIINRVEREHISLRTKLVTSFNWVKINAIAAEKKILFIPYISFETKMLGVGCALFEPS